MFQKMLGLVVQQRYTTSGYSVKGFESLMQWYTLSIFLKWSQLWIFIPLYSLWAKKKRLWDRGLEKLKMLLTFFFWWLKKLSYLYMYREKTNCSTLKWITVKQKKSHLTHCTAKSVFCIYHDVLCNIWSLYSIKILMQHSNNMRLCNFSNQLLLIQPAAHLPELSILVFLPVFAHETQKIVISLPINCGHKIWWKLIFFSQLFK